ncbi:hypothetical protein Bca52824_001421 [Brassica carinata]|uniref:Uncharacterized protein n=1 Tax=Brassica carinata TaxID=52824 RepID=A0A8X7WHD2_BRACI|nr:hypothetical protein Bca52824_001421 [Brassica carinata]
MALDKPHMCPLDYIGICNTGLRADEYEELKESKLGVFIKFKELNFNWASRLVHYILGFQLKIKKKYELGLVGVEPMRIILGESGVQGADSYVKAANLEANSYTADGFIQVLGVGVQLLPDLGANFGNPQPNRPTPPLLAYKGGKGRRCFKEAILRQTKVINFIEKDFGEMFPRWEFDHEDFDADNIIKVMFNSNPKWKWTMDCWEVNQMNEVIAARL